MPITGVIPQLRTIDLAASIAFYTKVPGFTLELQDEDSRSLCDLADPGAGPPTPFNSLTAFSPVEDV